MEPATEVVVGVGVGVVPVGVGREYTAMRLPAPHFSLTAGTSQRDRRIIILPRTIAKAIHIALAIGPRDGARPKLLSAVAFPTVLDASKGKAFVGTGVQALGNGHRTVRQTEWLENAVVRWVIVTALVRPSRPSNRGGSWSRRRGSGRGRSGSGGRRCGSTWVRRGSGRGRANPSVEVVWKYYE